MVTTNYLPSNKFYYIARINTVKINYESLTVPIELDKNKNQSFGFTALGTESFIKLLFMSSSRF